MPQFAQQRPRFDTSQGNPISTFLGTAAESAASNITFGAWNPDIIPEQQEQLDPWATTAGRVAGSIAGFIGSIAAIESIGGLALTGFGAKILQAGKVGKVIGSPIFKIGTALAGKPATAVEGILKSGVAFGIHDVAQEYVHQIKTQDPDSYELAQKAFGGFVTGGMFGYMGQTFKNANTLIQVSTGAATLAFAETVDAAVEGRDITKEDIAKSMLIGGILSGMGSIGWKERAAKDRRNVESLIGGIKRGSTPAGEIDRELRRLTGNLSSELGVDLTKSMEMYKNAQKVAGWSTKRLKAKSDVPYFNEKTGRFFMQSKKVKGKNALEGPLPKAKVISGIPEKQYREIISSVSQGRTTSTKKITRGEAAEAFEQIQEYALNNSREFVKEQITRMGIDTNNLPEAFRGLDTILQPIDRVINNRNMGDLVGKVGELNMLKKVEERQWGQVIPALKKDWDVATKTTGLSRAKATFRNKATDGDTVLYNYLTGKATQPFTKEQKRITDEIRSITDMFFRRENEALGAMGKEPIQKVEHYLHILRDRKAAAEMGKNWDKPGHYYQNKRKRVQGGFNPTRVSRVEESAVPELINPWKSLETMIHYDLKDIYLHKPIDILNEKLKFLTGSKTINTRTADDVREYVNYYILGKQTPGAERINKAVKGFLENGKIGAAMDRMLKMTGRELGHRPAETIANTFGKVVTNAFIAFRPKLALRNLMQSFYGHGFVSTKNMAKGMGAMPKELENILSESAVYKISKLKPEEGAGAAGGQVSQAGMEVFGSSHIKNVDFTAKATFHQIADYVSESKYNKMGWADKVGTEARKVAKEAGNKNWRYVMSQTELGKAKKEIEFVVTHTQFLYDAMGMPGLFRNPLAKMAGKLTSYPINYTTKYIPEMWSRLVNGTPGWDKTGTVKIPGWQRMGLFKHFFVLGGILAGMEKAGFDYSQMLGISYSQEKADQGRIPIKFGVWNVRPSPAIKWLSAAINIHSEDQYTAAIARKDLESLILIPGKLAFQDLQKAKEKGSYTGVLFKERYERKRKKKTQSLFGTSYKPPRSNMHTFGIGGE